MSFLRYSYEIIPETEDPLEYERESDIIAGRLFHSLIPMKEEGSSASINKAWYNFSYKFPVVLGQLIYIDEYPDYTDTDSDLIASNTIFDRTLMRWYDNHKDQLTDHKNRLAIKNKIGLMVEKLSEYGPNEEAMIMLRWLHETGIDTEPSIIMLRIW